MKQSNQRAALLLLGVFALVMGWGYVHGDMRALLRQGSAEEKAAASQRAFDHLLGSDRVFDSAADNVTTAAGSAGDSVSWKLLAQAKFRVSKHKAPAEVDFPQGVEMLDGKEVTITGYMFPLQAAGEQGHFLLSAYPPSCPYCLPGGPGELIEIVDSKPLAFTYEAITLQGVLHLLRADALAEGMFYRMTQARLVRR